MKNRTGRNCIMQYGTVDPETCCAVSYCPYATPPVTNADRIRAMTDEELAELLCADTPRCPPGDCPGEDDCKDCWLNWLKEEVTK